MSYVLSQEKEKMIRSGIAAGLSQREIAKAAGASKATVARRLTRAMPTPIRGSIGSNECDHCGKVIARDREFHRRTRRTKHKFCGFECYGAFYSAKRAKVRCKRCSAQRGLHTGYFFTRGYCSRCYNIMRHFNFDEELAACHDLKHILKKEINNANAN